MSKITNKDFLVEGSCYKKVDTGKYLGKYKGTGSGDPRWGVATDYAYFENDTFLLNEINVTEVPCQSAPTIQTTSAALGAGAGAGAGVTTVPMTQQQWLSSIQLIPGRYYVDQNNVYLGRYNGNVHNFEKHILTNVPWNFYFQEVYQQRGGKKSRRAKRRNKKYTRKH